MRQSREWSEFCDPKSLVAVTTFHPKKPVLWLQSQKYVQIWYYTTADFKQKLARHIRWVLRVRLPQAHTTIRQVGSQNKSTALFSFEQDQYCPIATPWSWGERELQSSWLHKRRSPECQGSLWSGSVPGDEGGGVMFFLVWCYQRFNNLTSQFDMQIIMHQTVGRRERGWVK